MSKLNARIINAKDIPLPEWWKPQYELHVKLLEPYSNDERFVRAIDFMSGGLAAMFNGVLTTKVNGLSGITYIIQYNRPHHRDLAYTQGMKAVRTEKMGSYLKLVKIDVPEPEPRQRKIKVSMKKRNDITWMCPRYSKSDIFRGKDVVKGCRTCGHYSVKPLYDGGHCRHPRVLLK
jgi:hypothetical protein